MNIKLIKNERKEFKPFDLTLEIESNDELAALIAFMEITEPQTWMYADKVAEMLREKSNEFKI